MTTSLPGNIFATSSKEAIDLFLNLSENKVKFPEIISVLSDDQLKRSIICSPSYNSNLIDFEMNWNHDKKGYLSRFRFVETGSFFELQYVNKDLIAERVGQIISELNKSDLIAQELGDRDIREEGIQQQTKSKNELDFEKDLGRIANLGEESRLIYYCFGVGDDLSNWAGPFVGLLSNSLVTITENGLREIVLEFLNEEGKFLRNEVEGPNSKNIYAALDKYDNIYKNRLPSFEVNDVIPISLIEDDKTPQRLITGLIRDYIIGAIKSSNKNSNVIVLLPNIQNIIKNYISSKKDFLNNTGSYESIFNSMGLSCSKLFVDEKNYKELEDSIIRFKNSKLTFESNVTSSLAEFNYYAGLQDQVANTFGESIGDVIRTLNPLLDNQRAKKYFDRKVKETDEKLDRNIDVLQQKFKEEVKKQILSVSIKLNPEEKISEAENTPDYYYPLVNFNKGFAKFCADNGGYSYEQTLIIESDLQIINLWNSELFNGNLDPKKSVFIFGDINLINDLLYVSKCSTILGANDITINSKFISVNDKSLFVDNKQKFRQAMFLLKRKNVSNSSFEIIKKKTDELNLDEEQFFDSASKKLVSLVNCPLFRYNISNPNVLSLSVENLPTFIDVYNLAYKTKNLISYITNDAQLNIYSDMRLNELYNPSSTLSPFYRQEVTRSKTTKDGKREFYKSVYDKVLEQVKSQKINKSDIKEIFNYIVSLQGQDIIKYKTNLRAKSLFIYNEKTGETDEIKLDLQNNQVAAIYAVQVFEKLNGKQSLGPALEMLKQEEVVAYERSLFNKLCDKVQNVTIKTLPWFSINGYPADMICVLIGYQNFAGKVNEKQKGIYNGLYFIKGYKHVITPNEMYSEFLLGKKPFDIGQDK